MAAAGLDDACERGAGPLSQGAGAAVSPKQGGKEAPLLRGCVEEAPALPPPHALEKEPSSRGGELRGFSSAMTGRRHQQHPAREETS